MAPLLTGCALILAMVIFFAVLFYFKVKNSIINAFSLQK